MPRKRGNFTESYKAEAVKLCQESEQSIAEVARGLGLNETTLGNWIKKAAGAEAAGDGEPPPAAQELKRIRDLEAEVRRLNLENAFLKKASAYFASQSQ
jgi:transposase-like protein